MSDPSSWFRRVFAARAAYPPYLLARLLLVALVIFGWRARRRRRKNPRTLLCIEAGIRGWASIEFKELYAGAIEYLGDSAVRRVEIVPDRDYIDQVRAVIERERPTHYLYDARSGSQRWRPGIAQALRVALLLRRHGVVPVVLLADLSLRRHRAQSAIVTAASGVVVAFMAARLSRPIFPHDRLVAPSLMPFSESTLETIRDLRATRPLPPPARAAFIGLLYEPRTTLLNDVANRLSARSLELVIRGRQPGGARIPDSEYWETLAHNPIVLTTAEQVVTPQSDWPWITQMTYRYLEAMLCGTLLVAPAVPGVQRYFTPGKHYVPYDTATDAADTIEYYLMNESEREAIARQGCERAEALVRARVFWTAIDVALGPDSLT